MPKMTLDNGLVRITNDNETFEMAKMVIEGNREVEIYLQLPMPTNLLSWSQSIPKANDIGSSGSKPIPDLVNTIDESDSVDLFFEDKKKTFVILLLCGGGGGGGGGKGDEEYEFSFDDFEFDPEPRRKSGTLITELDKDQLLSQNKSGTQPPQTSQSFHSGVNNSRAAGFDKVGIRADNLGVDTEFHDAAYEQDETPFILNE
ncbi:hypothetical protein TorRG33x02_084590 [Trema orientale]|uniref:Uncharacterized protein n=1 Tax=Trema orientale TaxID=63057 RepID=A0A2P5FCW0_TREOI|nr:hypothetical protein TorRG33x02_084590 [Trema orientale]